jgi:hypothetical protein
MIDYLLIERALMGSLPLDQLNSDEKDFCDNYRSIFEIGRLAHRMAQGYYAHKVAIEVAKDPRADALVSSADDGVSRKDGTGHVYNRQHYLDYARANPEMVDDLKRVWLVGSLIAVGDALSDHDYLTRAPLLELIYHLRNGVAHGNMFTFKVGQDTPGLRRLKKAPANNGQARVKTAEFAIHGNLEGEHILFDFMDAGDVLDLLMSVEIYLTRIRELKLTELKELLSTAAAARARRR